MRTRRVAFVLPLLASCSLLALVTSPPGIAVGPSLSLNVSPGTIDPDYAGSVSLTVTDVAAITAADFELWTDVGHDGTIHTPSDYMVWSYRSPSLVPHDAFPDLDASANTVRIAARLFTPLGFPYSIGHYVFLARSGGRTVTKPFVVTWADPGTRDISFTVTEADTTNGVGGALAMLWPADDACDGPVYTAFTAADGTVTVPYPDDVTCLTRIAIAVRPNWLPYSSPQALTLGDSAHETVALEMAPGTVATTGTLRFLQDDLPVRGVLMVAESDGMFAAAFTDATGAFTFALSEGTWQIYPAGSINLGIQGAIHLESDWLGSYDVSGTSTDIGVIDVRTVDAWVSGTTPHSGMLVRGIAEEPEVGTYTAETVSDQSGAFQLPVVVVSEYGSGPLGTLDPPVPNDSLRRALAGASSTERNRPTAPRLADPAATAPSSPHVPLGGSETTRNWALELALPDPGLLTESVALIVAPGDHLTGQTLSLIEPTAWITGRIEVPDGTGVAAYCVRGISWGFDTRLSARALTRCDGSYALPVIDGDWEVRVDGATMFADALPYERPHLEQYITVSGASVTGLDVLVPRSTKRFTVLSVVGTDIKRGSQLLVEGYHFPSTEPSVTIGGRAATIDYYRPERGRMVVTVPVDAPVGFGIPVVVTDDEGGVIDTSCVAIQPGLFESECTLTFDAGPGYGPLAVLTFDVRGNFLAGSSTSVAAVPKHPNVPLRVSALDATGSLPSIDAEVPQCTSETIALAPHPSVTLTGSVDPMTEASQLEDIRVNVLAWVEGAVWRDTALTNADGDFTLAVPAPGMVSLHFLPPPGRLDEEQISDIWVDSGSSEMTTWMPLGSVLHAGMLTDPDGEGFSTIIGAAFDDTGARSQSCSGIFTRPGGSQPFEMYANSFNSAPLFGTLIGSEATDSDLRIPFPIPIHGVFEPFPLTSFLRVGPERSFMAKPGEAAYFFLEGLEDIPWSSYSFAFGDDASAGTSASAHLDLERGMVLTIVPADAEDGAVWITDGNRLSPKYDFWIQGGTASTPPYTLTVSVNDALDNPISGALVMLLARVDPSLDGSPLRVVSWNLSGPSGAALAHEGDADLPLSLLVLPPRSGGIPGGQVDTSFGPQNASLVWKAPTQVTTVSGVVHYQFNSSELALPRARVVLQGSGYFETAVTDDSGAFSVPVPSGLDVSIQVHGPVGSRLLGTTLDVSSPDGELAQPIVLTTGLMYALPLTDEDGAPVAQASVMGYGADDPWPEYFWTSSSREGVVVGTIPYGSTASARITPPLGFAAKEIALDAPAARWSNYDVFVLPTLTLDREGGTASGHAYCGDTSTVIAGAAVSFHRWTEAGGFDDAVIWDAAGDDGSFTVVLPPGSYAIEVHPPDGSSCLSAWYADDDESAACRSTATLVEIAVDEVVDALDVVLPIAATITGTVTEYLAPHEGAHVFAESDALGVCALSAVAGENGTYTLRVPAGSGYELRVVNADETQTVCWEEDYLCAAPVPITASAATPFTANVDFGMTPGEVDAPQLGQMLVTICPACQLGIVFDELDGGPRVEAYNIYEGQIGQWSDSSTKYCQLGEGADLRDMGNGRWRYALTPASGNTWYLVTASNVLGEGSAGHSRSLPGVCGATSVQTAEAAAPARPLPHLARLGETDLTRAAAVPAEARPAGAVRTVSHPAFARHARRSALAPARLVRASRPIADPNALWRAHGKDTSAWIADLQRHRQIVAIDSVNAVVRVDGAVWSALSRPDRKDAGRALAAWLASQGAPRRFSIIDHASGQELSRWRGWLGLKDLRQ